MKHYKVLLHNTMMQNTATEPHSTVFFTLPFVGETCTKRAGQQRHRAGSDSIPFDELCDEPWSVCASLITSIHNVVVFVAHVWSRNTRFYTHLSDMFTKHHFLSLREWCFGIYFVVVVSCENDACVLLWGLSCRLVCAQPLVGTILVELA